MNQTLAASLLDRINRAFRDVAETARTLRGVSYREDLPDGDIERLQQQIDGCVEARGGEVTSRARAAELGQVYLALNAQGRKRFLRLLIERYGIDRARLANAIETWRGAAEAKDEGRALAAMRNALESPAMRLLAQFTALPQGVKFLVDLRANLLDLVAEDARFGELAEDLRRLLAGWFDVGFLNLERITWRSPAVLLEKLVDYEAVHEIRSWRDLKNRLDSDRRCFAFFHPRMPDEPLIFVEVALVDGTAASIQALLDDKQPTHDPRTADAAIFYSISNCQKGLAGVSFGNFLIKRVADELARELPNLKTFATLSPVPGFRAWLDREIAADRPDLLTASDRETLSSLIEGEVTPKAFARLLERKDWRDVPALREALKTVLTRLCARYLVKEKERGRAIDPVARFHLANGARIERINFLGDTSRKGMRQAIGLMVNYRYKLDEVEANHEAYSEGRVVAHPSVAKQAKG
ncbi:malonyl-CoA decarboxylase [Desertibaculum subflavum]|uniref:malonyl-CoA decarboxylase n=1 Tax=Desertibaculum subflavum TaxID=2268458 RepID=UPI000E665CAB